MKNKDPLSITGRQTEYYWTWSAVCALVIILTIIFRYFLPVRDGDLFFHMLYGKYYWANKTLIADHTIYSWTPTTNNTIYCTWLADIFLYFLYQAFGFPGLFAFRYACLFFLVLTCFLLARKLRIAMHPMVWLCCLIGVLMVYAGIYLKPEIISFVLMTFLVWNWYHIRTGGKNLHRFCYAIPLIMLIWVNSHGAFVFGYIFLITVVIGEVMNRRWNYGHALPDNLRKHLWASIGLSLIVPLANPYGWRYPFQLFWSLMPTEANLAYNSKIAAYLPTFKHIMQFHAFGLYANLAILILAVLYVLKLKRREIDWSSLLSNLVFASLYTKFLRTTYFFAPVFVFSSVAMLENTRIQYFQKYAFIRAKVFPLVVSISVVLISFDAIHTGYVHPERFVQSGEFGIALLNPVDSAEYIKAHFPRSKIGNTYTAGAYLLWKLWPNSKVIFDARHFPYKHWSDEYFDFAEGKNFAEFEKKYKADLWCIAHDHVKLYKNFISSEDWKLAFYGRGTSIFVPKTTPLPGGKTFEVAENIDNIRNVFILYKLFIFSVTVRDWPTANTLINQMSLLSAEHDKDPRVISLKNMVAGMKAIASKDYNEAFVMLNKSKGDLGDLTIFLAISHLHLAVGDLNAKRFNQARRHVYAASSLLPDSIYSYYNIGIIDWIFFEHIAGYRNNKVTQSYTNALQGFLKKTTSEQGYEKYAESVKRILSGQYGGLQQQPELLIPEIKVAIQ